MLRRGLPKPTNADLEILTVLWSIGPATVRRSIRASIAGDPQYSTTLKFMQIMANKGLLRRDEKQRAHVYEAVKTRAWTRRQLAGDLLERAIGGSPKALLGAVSARKATKEELAELLKLLDDYKRGQK